MYKLGVGQVDGSVLHDKREKTVGQKADGEHADQAVEEPDDFPQPVALDDMKLALRESEERIQLRVADPDSDAHVNSSFSSATAKLLPVRCMKTSSRVGSVFPFACRRQSSSGLPSASTRPPSIISTRAHSSAASAMSCVHRRTVTSRSSRSTCTGGCTSFL